MGDTNFRDLVIKTIEFSRISDVDLLLEQVLIEAIKFLNADAGTIYLIEKDELVFKFAKNYTFMKTKADEKKDKYTTFKMPINNESIAGYVAKNNAQLNIPDAYKLDKSLPYRLNDSYDKKMGYKTKSILVTPLTTFDNKIVGVLQIINKKNTKGEVIAFSELDQDLTLKYFANYSTLFIERALHMRNMILRMVKMSELRDPSETGAHVNRVSYYSVEIFEDYAKKIGMDEKETNKNIDILRMAAMLHDVGKVAISDKILKKPGRLNDEEFSIMRMHTVYGAKLFTSQSNLYEAASRDVALNHHERWDGKGYPGTLENVFGATPDDMCKVTKAGEDIPLFGRIVAIADVYDAPVSQRCYKPAWSVEDAMKEIQRCAGSQFDPNLVQSFVNSIDHIEAVRKLYS